MKAFNTKVSFNIFIAFIQNMLVVLMLARLRPIEGAHWLIPYFHTVWHWIVLITVWVNALTLLMMLMKKYLMKGE